MATRWAVQNGNWSATSTWDGGTLPTSADDVYADGKTVAIDQTITVLSLRTTQRSGGTVAGSFNAADGITINATGNGLVGGRRVVTIVGGPLGVTINGNINGGADTYEPCVVVNGTGQLTVNGTVTAGSTLGAHGIQCGSAAPLAITGNVIGGPVNASNNSYGVYHTGAGSVTITGNVTSSVQSGGFGVYHTGSGNVTITGNVTGGSNSSSIGVFTERNNNGVVLSIVGTITAGTGALAHGVYDTNTSGTSVSIGGYTTVGGSLIDSTQGVPALVCRRFRCIPTLNTIRQHANNTGFPSGTPVIYGSLDYIPNNVPVPANVRSGTVYGNNQYTGTLAVPPASAVSSGVPVDNTIGTGVVSPADIAGLVGAQIAALLSS